MMRSATQGEKAALVKELREERYRLNDLLDAIGFSKAIADYIDYYNNSRIQAKTKWMPPTKFREASMAIT